MTDLNRPAKAATREPAKPAPAIPGKSSSAVQTAGDAKGRSGIALPTHDEIAKRAYDIYVKSGHKQGLCNQNWLKAEQELRAAAPRP